MGIACIFPVSFAAGWREYEWRWAWPECPQPRRHLHLPLWRSEALSGKRILVWAEQGYGDCIQFLPLVHRLSAAGAEVVLEVAAPLARLLAASLPGIRVRIQSDQPQIASRATVGLDYAVPLTPEAVPAPSRDNPVQIGLVWAGKRARIAGTR